MKSDRERWKRELARERKKKKSKRREAAFAFHAVIIEQASDEIGQRALEARACERKEEKEKQAPRSGICFSCGYYRASVR